MGDGGILAEAVAEAAALLGDGFAGITVRRAVVGLYFTGVALEAGVAAPGGLVAGACTTPARPELHAACCPAAGDPLLRPGSLRGRAVTELLAQRDSPRPLHRALAIAALNAMAELCWQRRPWPEVERLEADAFAAAAIAPGERVVLVGAFIPFLRALKQRGQPYTVLERSPAMLKPEELPHYRPAAEAAAVLPRGDVVLVTGSTLLEPGSLEALLALARPSARVVVAGPSAGLFPGPFLRRGVDLVGGIAVTAPDRFLDVLAEGGAGEHLFGESATRLVLRRRAAAHQAA